MGCCCSSSTCRSQQCRNCGHSHESHLDYEQKYINQLSSKQQEEKLRRREQSIKGSAECNYVPRFETICASCKHALYYGNYDHCTGYHYTMSLPARYCAFRTYNSYGSENVCLCVDPIHLSSRSYDEAWRKLASDFNKRTSCKCLKCECELCESDEKTPILPK